MSGLRERLEALREEAREFFARDAWGTRTNNSPRPQIAPLMADVGELIRTSFLLPPTSLSTHQKNTRRMASALKFKEYRCWDASVDWREDIIISRAPAGEEEYEVSVGTAESIFIEALDGTLELLEIAESEKCTTPSAEVDVNGEALDHGFRNPSNHRKLLNQLTALIRRGRIFAHAGTPLFQNETDTLVSRGRRCLLEIYGEDSRQEGEFVDQAARAILPWYTTATEHGRVYKADYNVFESGVDRVRSVNKINLRNALQVLIDAAHRCRSAAPDPAAKPNESAVYPGELADGDAPCGEESEPAQRPLKSGGRPRLYVDGERIRKLRGRQSQAAFARFCGISPDALQNAERGNCSKETIDKIEERLLRDGKIKRVEELHVKNPPQ